MNRFKTLRAPTVALFLALSSLSAATHAGLIAYYTFEGSAADVSGNGNHGTLGPTAPSYTASGYQGGAYQFGTGGANTYLTVPVNINPSALPQLTFGAWVNADVADAVIRGLISHDNGGFDRTLTVDTRNGDGVPNWQVFSSAGTHHFGGATGNVTVGQWAFIAAVYDVGADTSCIYVDGAYGCVADTPITNAVSVTTIGRNPNFDFPFIGRMDNVFFFDEALSRSQLDDIRRNGIAVPEPGSLALAGLGLGAAFWARRRRR